MTLSAVFSADSNKYEPSILGTVPQTGTFINMATDEVLDTLLASYQRECFTWEMSTVQSLNCFVV